MADNFRDTEPTNQNKSGKIKLINAIIAIILTNLFTASVLIFAPIPFIGGKKIVSNEEYEFIKQFKKMIYVKKIVESEYVDKIDENKMVDGALKGMVEGIGDRYTVYMDQQEFDALKTHTGGSYAGIGIYIDEKDGKIVVVAPIEGSPAEKAGIKSGDFIIKVNGIDVTAKDMEKAVSMMKGKVGTKVKVTTYREGKGLKDYELTRAKIIIPSIKNEMLQDKIGYIRITNFDENTADSFMKALNKLKAEGMNGLIIDLRDNGGGLLDQATEIADELLGKGTIVYTIDKNGERLDWTSDENKLNMPLVLLVNGGTASASEILSGAVRDFKAGVLIGTKTFGKGLVQSVIDLKDGTGVKVTTSRYYTPSGECIQGKGITPDIVLELPLKNTDREITKEEDVQLKKAIEVIKSKR